MKLLIVMMSLLAFTACNQSESSKTRTCTFNDEPVECSTLEASEENLNLNAEVTTDIRIISNTFEVLAHTHNFEKETLNGTSYECEVSTNASDLFYYKVAGNKLHISKDGQTEILSRVEGNENELIGTWTNERKDSTGRTIQTLIFTEESMTIKANCIFNS